MKITVDQMRALASMTPGNKMLYATEIAAALEKAADQLEAVPAQRDAFLDSPNLDPVWVAGWHAAIDHVTHILTADAAPRESYAQCIDRQSREAVEKRDLEPRTGRALSDHCTCWKAGVL